MAKSRRTKATDIPQRVKVEVWERDGERCIICGSHSAMPNAHYIPRSAGGIGIAENIFTACFDCHRRYDQTTERPLLRGRIRQYLMSKYPDWDESKLYYRKGVDANQ